MADETVLWLLPSQRISSAWVASLERVKQIGECFACLSSGSWGQTATMTSTEACDSSQNQHEGLGQPPFLTHRATFRAFQCSASANGVTEVVKGTFHVLNA